MILSEVVFLINLGFQEFIEAENPSMLPMIKRK